MLKPRTTGESVRVDDDWFFRRDGSMIAVAYSSAPFALDSGTGAVVATRDMSGVRQTEDELRVLQTATMTISAAEDFETAVAQVIREVCVESGWVAGEMWLPTEDGSRLELAPGWWAASQEMEEFFVEASAPQTMGPGEGLPGLVWVEQRAAWIDVITTKRRGPRIDTARRVGFVAGVAMPVLAEGVVAVLGFFADHRRTEDDRWTNVLSAIAAQLGPILSRKHAKGDRAAGGRARALERRPAPVRRARGPRAAAAAARGRADARAGAGRRARRRLQDAIDGLLRYASVGKPATRPIAAAEVADQAIADLSLEIERAGATIARQPLPSVAADATQLRLVFHNLLANAIRYRSDEPLGVEIGSSGGVFFVRDNGRGIDPQDHGRVFELFRRGASAGDVDGVGIGLALSRRVVEAHGGELWLESEPGCGATFFFTLPPAA